MLKLVCERCGNPNMTIKNGVAKCDFCGFTLVPEKKTPGFNKTESSIGLKSDIEILLEKCKKEPKNARRYANRILDIDPSNKEALKYLK